jgi:hypothetical protein
MGMSLSLSCRLPVGAVVEGPWMTYPRQQETVIVATAS